MQPLTRLITTIENLPFSLGNWAITFFAIVSVRILLENFFTHFGFQFTDHYFYHVTHSFFAFLTIFLCTLPIVRWAGRLTFAQAASFLTVGFLIIWSVPIIEAIISHGEGFWSFYTFDSLPGLWRRYLTFFGDKPHIGTTYGIRIEIAAATILVSLYAFFKSKQAFKALAVAALLYTTLFILASFPSWITIALDGSEHGFFTVNDTVIAARMLSPAPLYGFNPPDIASSLNVKMSLILALFDALVVATLLAVYYRSLFSALAKNARFPQIAYHMGLFLLGALLALRYTEGHFRLELFHVAGAIVCLLAVLCAWLASVVINDIADQKIDSVTNPRRPLPSGILSPDRYSTIGMLFFAASIVLAFLVSTQAALLLIAYQAIAWLYSAPPLRLKRFPLIATILAAVASLLVLFAGFIVFSSTKNIIDLPWPLYTFLFIAYTLALPIKDFKDIAGDAADKVFTLPVLLGEMHAKRLVGGFLFLLFMASVFILRIERLFLLAFFFGSLAYWLVVSSRQKKRWFSYRVLPGWLMFLTSVYGLFLFFALLSEA